MTGDEYEIYSAGRGPLLDYVADTTRIVREQIEASEYLRKPEAKNERYAMAIGALLAFVPDEAKAELLSLIRDGGVRAVAE